jgi:hypothetical protein
VQRKRSQRPILLALRVAALPCPMQIKKDTENQKIHSNTRLDSREQKESRNDADRPFSVQMRFQEERLLFACCVSLDTLCLTIVILSIIHFILSFLKV